MGIIDRKGVIPQVRDGKKVTLELGCGNVRRDTTAIGIDLMDLPTVDLVGDVFEVLSQFPEGSVEGISTSHFMEHIPNLPRLMAEISRVLVPGGTVSAVVPHFSNPFYYSDPTHCTPFGLYTLAYFCEQNLFARGVPSYSLGVPMVLDDVILGFKSIRPRYITHAIRRSVGAIFNSCMFMRELYEENFCWIIPCYEIHIKMHRKI